MNCDRCKDLLPLKATGDLDEKELDELEGHLAECSECRNEAAEFDQLTASLARSDSDRLTELERLKLENALLKKLIAPRTGRRSASGFPARRVLVRLAASIVLVVAGFFLNSVLRSQSERAEAESDRMLLTLSSVSDNTGIATGHRFSAAGLKLIARGKSALTVQ